MREPAVTVCIDLYIQEMCRSTNCRGGGIDYYFIDNRIGKNAPGDYSILPTLPTTERLVNQYMQPTTYKKTYLETKA